MGGGREGPACRWEEGRNCTFVGPGHPALVDGQWLVYHSWLYDQVLAVVVVVEVVGVVVLEPVVVVVVLLVIEVVASPFLPASRWTPGLSPPGGSCWWTRWSGGRTAGPGYQPGKLGTSYCLHPYCPITYCPSPLLPY